MKYSFKEIGARIKSEREKIREKTDKGTKKISQDSFIELINQAYYNDEEWVRSESRPGIIARNTLSEIENGHVVTLDLRVISAMAKIFKCDMPYLFCETDCRKVNGITIHETTGLTESASDKLCEIWEDRKKDFVNPNIDVPCHIIEMLSEIISNPKFADLMNGIYQAKMAQKDYREYQDGLKEAFKNKSMKEELAIKMCDNEYNEYKNRYEGSRYMLGLTFNDIIKDICESNK